MAGPMNEKCGTCYYWDLDGKWKDPGDKRWYSECCYDVPSARIETFNLPSEHWCSEYENRDLGIKRRTLEQAIYDEETADE